MDTLNFVTGTHGTPLGLDVTTPNVARMYDWLRQLPYLRAWA
jgi:hypothetical protein